MTMRIAPVVPGLYVISGFTNGNIAAQWVADGPTDSVVVSSPAFAPQVAKIMAPERWLHVDQVARALATSGAIP